MLRLGRIFGTIDLKDQNEDQKIQFTKHNINDLFNQCQSSYPFKTKVRSEFFLTYQIEQRIFDQKNQWCHIFKITKNNKVLFFVVDFAKQIGNGCSGRVYEGPDITDNTLIVVKYGEITHNEIISLQKTNQYIAHFSDCRCVLMHKAQGIDYEQIIKDKSISDLKKIIYHAKILNHIIEFATKYNIYHGDI